MVAARGNNHWRQPLLLTSSPAEGVRDALRPASPNTLVTKRAWSLKGVIYE